VLFFELNIDAVEHVSFDFEIHRVL
jgi:hypothetical protein